MSVRAVRTRPTRRPVVAPVRFTAPYRTGREEQLLAQVLASPMWHGDGVHTRRAEALLQDRLGGGSVHLTPSCTHALELAALLLGLGPGDEVVCPSFTFTSTATAIAIRGATPVFVDVRPDTLNLDVDAVAAALTERTRAVFVVHYGGVAADVERLAALCRSRGVALVEDNAHGLGGSWNGRALGSFGTFATQSFHDTKNVTSGEGGALVVNDPSYRDRAEVVREKGTDRSRFLRGEVDKYTWQDHGSSYLPSELQSAVLVAQLEAFDDIQARRHRVWDRYAAELAPWAAQHGVRPMAVPEGAAHPAHLFYVLMPTPADQAGLIHELGTQEISAVFHYQPLDSSPAGLRLGRTPVPCTVTADVASRLVRLPLHAGLTEEEVDRVLHAVTAYRPVA